MANNYYQATVSPELPAHLFTAEELRLLTGVCGLSAEAEGEDLYFFAEEYFSEIGEGEDGRAIDCTQLFQAKLRQLDAEAYPAIVIHGAATCSKMRPDEFAGFAIFITREEIRSHSTWQWLDEQQPSDSRRKYSVLLLYPDYLDDTGYQTYYAFVVAADTLSAVACAQAEAVRGLDVDDPTDFHPLLVMEGHHRNEPLWNR